jgi:hypothetical protein
MIASATADPTSGALSEPDTARRARVFGDRFRSSAGLASRERFGDIPIAGDEPSDLTSGGLVVGIADATLHRQPSGRARSGAGPAPGETGPSEGSTIEWSISIPL